MDCFLWKFLRTCLPFSSILLTLFFLMSLCRFKKTGIHLTTYLKCLTTPSCTRSNSPPKVWYQNHTKPVCSLSLWKYLRFQILALERIRSKQGHGAGSPGPINRCSGRWTALLRHQRSPTAWVHEAHVSHATAQGPVNIAWKCAASPTQRGSHLFGYFPSSWDVREGSQLCVTLLFLFHGAIMTPTGEFQFTHTESFQHTLQKCTYWVTIHERETGLCGRLPEERTLLGIPSYRDRWLLRCCFQCS